MREYRKIETLFERDMNGSKKLVEGLYRNPTVEYLKDNKWQFTEKVDGTNIRIFWDSHKISFAGRTDRAQIPVHLANKLAEIFSNNETEELFEQKFGDKEVILFGEGYGVKIQDGGSYRSDVGFILFDVMIGDNFQSRETVESIAQCFNLEVVPIIMEGTLQEAVDFVKTKPNSTIGTAKMEGLVGKPMVEMQDRCGHRLIVKIKTCDFL